MPDTGLQKHSIDRPAPAATTVLSAGIAATGELFMRRVAPVSSRKREIVLADARFPSGRAHLLAWDVIRQGRSDLSMWLCRSGSGDFFLLCRSGNRPDRLPAIVPLSPARAATWFAAHATHVGVAHEVPTGRADWTIDTAVSYGVASVAASPCPHVNRGGDAERVHSIESVMPEPVAAVFE